MTTELSLFPEFNVLESKSSSTFADNMKLPIHRWYRYTAGFSAQWVGQVIEEEKLYGRQHIVDPFAGSGTVSVECAQRNVDSYGVESNPYVYKIAKSKLAWTKLDTGKLIQTCKDTLDKAKQLKISRDEFPALIAKCFPSDTLQKLEALKIACMEIDNNEQRDFVWFLITSILRSTSPVGTAQWQYIQPNKTKAKVLDPFDAFSLKLREIYSDIILTKGKFNNCHQNIIINEDSRNIISIPDKWADLVITSPPYANNYDYADAMRLEMLFWDDISSWKDLQEKVSSRLIRACTQHVSNQKNEIELLMDSDLISCIKDELYCKYQELRTERENHGGKKNYHTMIAAYFYDIAKVFRSLYRISNDNCKICFVIGDSAPYGIYIPVDEWMGKIALSAGFSNFSFEKLRDRNIKWKNRKHRIPLKEGRLWINK